MSVPDNEKGILLKSEAVISFFGSDILLPLLPGTQLLIRFREKRGVTVSSFIFKSMEQLNHKYEPHECANCGRLMQCTGDMNCWCISIEIPEEVQDYIAATFEGCLCKECIGEMIARIGK